MLKGKSFHLAFWPMLAVSLFAVFINDAPWRGQWNWTLDAVVGSTALTGPLAAAIAAFAVHRHRGILDITFATDRGRLVPARAAGEATVVACTALGLAGAVAMAYSSTVENGGPLTWWALLMAPAVLACSAMLGALVATAYPHWTSVVLVAPTLFLLASFGPPPLADLLRHGPATGGLAGLDYRIDTFTIQLVGLLGLGLLGLATSIRWRRERLERSVLAIAIVGAVSLALSAVILVPGRSPRFEVSAETPSACRGSAPQICVSPSNRRHLARVSAAMRPALDLLKAEGITLPARYEELLPGRIPPVSSGVITDLGLLPRRADPARGAGLSLTPASCPAWRDPQHPPPDQVFASQDLITGWILALDGERPSGWDPESRAWLASSGSPAARAWVDRTFDMLRTCRLSDIRLPWSTTG